jgi:hypothetical protein
MDLNWAQLITPFFYKFVSYRTCIALLLFMVLPQL